MRREKTAGKIEKEKQQSIQGLVLTIIIMKRNEKNVVVVVSRKMLL